MRNQVARPPTVTVTSQHPPTGDEPIEFYYEDCAELTNARVPKKTESRAAWIRRMATPRQHATTQSKPQASDRSQTVATRPFLHDGAMNRTHLNLFSWYPEITNVHPSKPSVQSSSSTSSSSSNLKPSRDCVLVDAHNGLTSFRHRSFPHGLPGSGIPKYNQRLDLTKDRSWVACPYASKYPHSSKGVYSFRDQSQTRPSQAAPRKPFHGISPGGSLFEKVHPYSGASIYGVSDNKSKDDDNSNGKATGENASAGNNDDVNKPKYVNTGRAFVSSSAAMNAADPRLLCGSMPNYRDEALLARQRASAIEVAQAAKDERERAHRLKPWKAPRPLSPVEGDDTSRLNQETTWSADRTCNHRTQDSIRIMMSQGTYLGPR